MADALSETTRTAVEARSARMAERYPSWFNLGIANVQVIAAEGPEAEPFASGVPFDAGHIVSEAVLRAEDAIPPENQDPVVYCAVEYGAKSAVAAALADRE